MSKPTYPEISQAIDDMVRAVVTHQQERYRDHGGNNGMAWAAASGTLISMLTDAIAQCPARAQREFMTRIEQRRVEYEQETIMERLKQ
jgi:hypothetical protein